MIPAINMGKIVTDGCGEVREHGRSNGSTDRGKLQQEIHSSTPLRNRSSTRNMSRGVRDASPHRTSRTGAGIANMVEDSSSAADLRRRAEEVTPVLGVNVLQVQDIFALRCKAVEVAERIIHMEEWYNVQLQERSAYLEYRIAQLSAAISGQGTQAAMDKWATPTRIRSRLSTGGTETSLSRPTLSVTPTSSIPHATGISHAVHAAHAAPSFPSVNATPPAPSIAVVAHTSTGTRVSCANNTNTKTPDSSRFWLSHRHSTPLTGGSLHSPSRDLSKLSHASLRNTANPRRHYMTGEEGGHISGSRTKVTETGTERRKVRSSSIAIGRGSRKNSDMETEEPRYDVARRPKKHRSLGAAALLSIPMRNTTPKRAQPSTGRLGYSSLSTKRE